MTGESNSILDVTDQEVLSKTKQKSEGNTLQLTYLLPSGRKLTSEAFQKEHGAKALIAWCDVVREQMMVDAQNVRDKARMEWQEQKAREKREASGLVDASGNALAPAQPAITNYAPIPTGGVPATSAVISSPDDFIQGQVAAAREALERIEWQIQELMQALVTARANVQKWETLALSLAPPQPFGQGTPVLPTSRRRGRPAKSSEQGIPRKVKENV